MSSKFWWDNASDNETRCIDTWMRRIKFVRQIEVHALVMFVSDIYIYINILFIYIYLHSGTDTWVLLRHHKPSPINCSYSVHTLKTRSAKWASFRKTSHQYLILLTQWLNIKMTFPFQCITHKLNSKGLRGRSRNSIGLCDNEPTSQSYTWKIPLF